MLYDTPLRKRHELWVEAQTAEVTARVANAERPGAATAFRAGSFEVTYLPYGPEAADGDARCEIVASFGPLEPEYAAIRRSAGMLDSPHRAIIEVRGSDRIDFLDRMITQSVGSLAPGAVCRSFWLDRKGRITSDLLIGNLPERTILETDIHDAARTVETLDEFLFTEDVTLTFEPTSSAQLRVHGPSTLAMLGDLLENGDPGALEGISQGLLAGCEVVIIRCDDTGEPGVVLSCAREDVGRLWDALLAWETPAVQGVRPIGWSAYNTARIEAGSPLFNIDFGNDSLPHETGVLHDRVDFKKGCYLGQEIVARIESLGHPKQVLRAIALETDLLPVAGAQVFCVLEAEVEGKEKQELLGPQVGWVSSSTIAPLLGAKPIAFAMLKFDHSEPGTRLLLTAEGTEISATVQENLRFVQGSGQ